MQSVSQNSSQPNDLLGSYLLNSLNAAKTSNKNIKRSNQDIQELAKAIPNYPISTLNCNSDVFFQDFAKSIQKIKQVFKRKINGLINFLKKPADVRYYKVLIEQYDLEIQEKQSALRSQFEQFKSHLEQEPVNLDKKTVFTAVEQLLEANASQIKYLNEIAQLINHHVEHINAKNNPKLAKLSSFVMTSLTEGPIKGVGTFLATTISENYFEGFSDRCTAKIMKWAAPDFFGPNIADAKNKYVSCHFRSLSSGYRALLLYPSQTKGVIKISFSNNEEFFLYFNLDENPILDPLELKDFNKTISKLTLFEEISKEESSQIYQELGALKISGRLVTIYMKALFNEKFVDYGEIENFT